MKSKRGLSTIVGIVFFIIVFTGVASYVTYSMNHLDQFGQTIIEKSQEDRNRDREQFEIASVSRDNNKFNITVQNTGELPINITRLWVQNKTDPSWGTSKFDVNKNVSPGQTLTKIGQNLPLTALTTQGYDIRLTTERGNAKEFLVNSVSQEPVYLQLFALPDDLPTGYTATLLLAVTNNMSNNGVLTNFKPNTPVVTYPVGASVTPLSGPEPTVYSSLAKGDTAYFQWTYRITGSNGQQIKFEASLQNGYLANSVSNNVTINVAGSRTIMGGGLNGVVVSITQPNYIRFFGDDSSNTNYSLKSMTVPISGTFKNLYVSKGSGPTATTFTLYKNSVATTLTCSTGALAQATCSDTTHLVSVVAGDNVAVGISTVGLSVGDLTFSIEFDPT